MLQALLGLGPGGLVIWFMWKKAQEDRADRKEREGLDREALKEETAAKTVLASALTALSLKIDGLGK